MDENHGTSFHRAFQPILNYYEMNLTAQIAKQFRDVHFGGNWTAVNLEENLSGLSWQQAATRVHSFNTIASLVYHMNYYVNAVSQVLEGKPLHASDKHSFNHPPILTQEDWDYLLDKTWRDAERFAVLIENLPESKLWDVFSENKYGTYYRNIQGVIEHIHYHLGQIVLIRKLILQEDEN
jgi:hypothetical protein